MRSDGTSRGDRISILLVDDKRLWREGLASLIETKSPFTVVAAAASGDEARHTLEQAKPDIVLIDIGLESGDGLRLMAALKEEPVAIRVVVMGLLPSEPAITQFIEAGAVGFLMKDAAFETFVSTIEDVADGIQVLPSELTGSLFNRIVADASIKNPAMLQSAMCLTARELQVVELVGASLTNKEIGSKLRIAESTVKCHVHNILEKLALRSRFELPAASRNDGNS